MLKLGSKRKEKNIKYLNPMALGYSRWKSLNTTRRCFLSPAFMFFGSALLMITVIGYLYACLAIFPYLRPQTRAIGCREDSEGSWTIGFFYGKSPFELKPIEMTNYSDDTSSAWPVANPVVTCASMTDPRYPSNFVADPFLYVEGDNLYMFFETKNSLTMHGDIGVMRSTDKGVKWEYLGIALDEEWHLSYPYVFSYQGEIYMMPEGSKKGDLLLYRSTKFPLQWTMEKVLLKKPLVDATLVQYKDYYWLFGSDFTHFGTERNAELEIWYSDSPFGPWKAHARNPIYSRNRSVGARNAGRLFMYEGSLYRTGQDCGKTYGKKIRLYKVVTLSVDDFREVEVPLGIEESRKGRNAWNGVRYHHLDVQQLPSGDWIAVMDGDRVPSGYSTKRSVVGFVVLSLLVFLVATIGFLAGFVNCVFSTNWYIFPDRRGDYILLGLRPQVTPRLYRYFAGGNRSNSSSPRGLLRSNKFAKLMILSLLSAVAVLLLCTAIHFLLGGNGAEEPYQYNGHFSQFTMLTMTYDARLWNLKLYIKHYSRCASVREIVVVWNKGNPPDPSEFDSAVPVRIRVEEVNSLNNRFKVDPLIKTRAVLELDDDIMMTCSDLEKGFRVWREHPDRLVGFYPRFVDGHSLEYRDKRYAWKMNGYNMILTGAAFMDMEVAFKSYWSDETREGRGVVDELFNCEDVLMNFLYANASSSQTVEYVRPAWAIDTSKISKVAISRNTEYHYRRRTACLKKFSVMYGSISDLKREFCMREDGWDC